MPIQYFLNDKLSINNYQLTINQYGEKYVAKIYTISYGVWFVSNFLQ